MSKNGYRAGTRRPLEEGVLGGLVQMAAWPAFNLEALVADDFNGAVCTH
jgi:hypothetical protein